LETIEKPSLTLLRKPKEIKEIEYLGDLIKDEFRTDYLAGKFNKFLYFLSFGFNNLSL